MGKFTSEVVSVQQATPSTEPFQHGATKLGRYNLLSDRSGMNSISKIKGQNTYPPRLTYVLNVLLLTSFRYTCIPCYLGRFTKNNAANDLLSRYRLQNFIVQLIPIHHTTYMLEKVFQTPYQSA